MPAPGMPTAAAVAAVAAALAACMATSDAAYCRALDERDFETLTMVLPDAPRADVLEWGTQYRGHLEAVAAHAPEAEVAENWERVLAELDLRLQAVRTAGPDGLSHEQVEAAVSPTLRERGWHVGRTRIGLDARRRCGVALW